uniref:MaoC-like domain-containing protein n=1 Tax=Panagrolaimus sp. JU765 TaxID=591449 RepID=A0AC34QMF6_9BILA
MNPELARSHKPPPETFEYTFRDGILYALGIGAKATDLQWIYEGNDEFHLFPTYVIAPGLLSNSLGGWPGIDFDLTRILHGEQYIEVFEPLPTDGRMVCQVSIPDVVDKGSGALILTDINISGPDGKKLAYLQMGTFQVGSGGFGGVKNSPKAINGVPPPKRYPDKVTEDKVSLEQAALYRLGSRDMNPLHYIEVFEPLPTDGRMICQVSIPDVVDKGSGALILTDINISGPDGKKLAYLQMGTFQVGSGGFGGVKNSPKAINGVPPPKRYPDKVTEDKVSLEQAALYRLGSRDMNPLHVDPSFAKLGGFKKPILHGMCTLGFSVRHVINAFAGGDARKFRAVKARFTSPVDLGSTLVFEMWKEGKRVHFQTKVKETNKFVIQQAYVDLTEEAKL